MTTGSYAGERVISTPAENIEVRVPVARSLPVDTTGHAVILFRLGFPRLADLGDTYMQPGVYWLDRMAMSALAIFAAIAGFYGFLLHWWISVAAVAIIAPAITDCWHVGQVIKKRQSLQPPFG